MRTERVRCLRSGAPGDGPVVYWMSRDQRAADNWALLYAQELALEQQAPLVVAFCLAPTFLGGTWRAYDFLLRGLRALEQDLGEHGIGFQLLCGQPPEVLPPWLHTCRARAVVVDFSPLRIARQWLDEVVARLDAPIWQVDAHNVVPCWLASPKQEYGAYTLRPRLQRLLPLYLEPFPELRTHPYPWPAQPPVDFAAAEASLLCDRSVSPVAWLEPGERAGAQLLMRFVAEKLARYDEQRNDPNLDGQSQLSPYLHFGQLAPQRVALQVANSEAPVAARQAFLEELLVRRELAENYCYYNLQYDSDAGWPDWARRTLAVHGDDARPYVYDRATLEQGATHDDLWNAAQNEMVTRGKLHGYLRMYWAKKLLEWTASPQEALSVAVDLNDRYELDGRDPNGYAGIAWSLGGVHDRPWGERPIFGLIRYMSYNGCKRKFDVARYIATHAPAGMPDIEAR